MKIGIDCRVLESISWGVGRVLSNLIKSWGQNGSDHQWVLYFRNSVPPLEFLNSENFEKKVIKSLLSSKSHRLWEQVSLSFELNRNPPDVFLSPSYILPLAGRCRMAVMVHDLSFEFNPKWYSIRESLELRGLTRWSVHNAEKVLCASDHTQKEIIKYYGEKCREKISIHSWAPEDHFKVCHENPMPRSAGNFKIPQPYFLFVGQLFRRRNIPLLIKAFKSVTDVYPEFSLVLVGKNHQFDEFIKTLTRQSGICEKVFHFDYLPEKDLIPLYQNAFCFIHPSSYEGFGLPMVEAMASGIPVVLLTAKAMVEVADGAAGVVGSLEENDLVRYLLKLIKNEDMRKKLVLKGLKRVQSLRWDAAAMSVLDVLKETELPK